MRFLGEELHTLTGAYALDALDSAELDRFTHHLHRCPACANEVRGLQETAARGPRSRRAGSGADGR